MQPSRVHYGRVKEGVPTQADCHRCGSEWVVSFSGYGKSFNTEDTEKTTEDTEDVRDHAISSCQQHTIQSRGPSYEYSVGVQLNKNMF